MSISLICAIGVHDWYSIVFNYATWYQCGICGERLYGPDERVDEND